MAFIRKKTVKGKDYYYLVESVREDGKVKQKILQYFGTTLPPDYVVPKKGKVSVTTTEKRVAVSTTLKNTYHLVKSVRELLGNKRSILKDFGTTLPSDVDIVAAIGTTPIPEGTSYYLVARGKRGKEKILKPYWDIANLISTTPPEAPISTTEKAVLVGFTDPQYEVIARRAEAKGLSPGDYLRWLTTRKHKKGVSYDW